MRTRRALWLEVVIVLALSLGASALRSILTLVSRLTQPVALSQQSAGLNQSRSERPWLDFSAQSLDIVLALAPVALVLYLLWVEQERTRPMDPFRRIGFDLTRPGRDILGALGLLALIGVPGLALYAAGRALGVTVAVVPSPVDTYWWTVPILIFSALRAALVEEIIVVGYLFTRLRQLGLSKWTTIAASALLRGSYHLYQGFGPFVGNVAMGVVFGWCYERWGRTMPLVIAHWMLDIFSFVGYPLALAWWPGLFAPAPPPAE